MPGAVVGLLAALGIVLGTVSQGHRGEGAVYATQHHHYHRLCRRHDGVPIASRACCGEPAGHAARRVRAGRSDLCRRAGEGLQYEQLGDRDLGLHDCRHGDGPRALRRRRQRDDGDAALCRKHPAGAAGPRNGHLSQRCGRRGESEPLLPARPSGEPPLQPRHGHSDHAGSIQPDG